MAIRIQRYDTPPRSIHAGAIDPGFSQPLIRDAGRTAESDLIHEMARAGMQITEVGIREYVKDQSTAVAAALNDTAASSMRRRTAIPRRTRARTP